VRRILRFRLERKRAPVTEILPGAIAAAPTAGEFEKTGAEGRRARDGERLEIRSGKNSEPHGPRSASMSVVTPARGQVQVPAAGASRG
jgi:hypothetical protein